MRAGFLTSSLLLATIACGQNYRSDQRLLKPISMRLKIASFSLMAGDLARETGVPITVAANLVDRKITLIFHDKPVAEAMQMVAKTFFGEWKPSGGGYIFELPREEISREVAMIAAEDVAMRAALDQAIHRMAEVARLAPDLVDARRKQVDGEITHLGTPKTDADKKALASLTNERAMLSMSSWRDLGTAFKSASSDQLLRLEAGTPIFASTESSQGMLPFSAEGFKGMSIGHEVMDAQGNAHWEEGQPTAVAAAIRYNEIGERLEVSEMVLGMGSSGAACMPKSLDLLYLPEVYEATKDKELRKLMSTWATATDPEVLKKAITRPEKTPTSPYMSKLLSMADHLEYVADNAGIPVIADAFRVPVSYNIFPTAKDIDAYFTELNKNQFMWNGIGYRRTDGGWLMYRHTRFWRQQEREIPEKLLAPLEAKTEWTLDDVAGLAAKLTPKQAYALSKRIVLVRFPRMPFTEAMPALRLWGNLPREQQQKAYRTGITPRDMSADQSGLYWSALQDLMWTGALNETFLAPLAKGQLPPGMSLFMQDAGNGAPNTLNMYDEVQRPPNDYTGRSIDSNNSKPQLDSRIAFLFGTSTKAAASYGFSLIPRKE